MREVIDKLSLDMGRFINDREKGRLTIYNRRRIKLYSDFIDELILIERDEKHFTRKTETEILKHK